MFTGLRLTEGVDMEDVGSRYGVDVWERFGAGLQPFLEARVLVRDGNRLAADPRGYACC